MDYLKIIFVYIGLIIGAGFASGREICEYFNFCSNTDYTGVCVACILFIFICYIILKKSMKCELYSIRDYIGSIFPNSNILRRFFLCLIFCDLLCGMIVMLSSCGEIINAQFELPKIAGTLFLSIACFIVFIYDIKGIAVINIILVPIITSVIIFIALGSIFSGLFQSAFLIGFTPDTNRNVFLCSVCYVSYNTLTAVSVLSPLTKNINSQKVIMLSSLTAGIIIGLLIFLLWYAIGINFPSVWYESFPLRKIAEGISTNLTHIYTVCLIMSIFTTAVSEGYGIISYFKADTKSRRIVLSLIMFAVLIPFSIINFASLVKYLYFYLGMFGTLWMIVILADYFKNLKHI